MASWTRHGSPVGQLRPDFGALNRRTRGANGAPLHARASWEWIAIPQTDIGGRYTVQCCGSVYQLRVCRNTAYRRLADATV
jgi:hypothetical protein